VNLNARTDIGQVSYAPQSGQVPVPQLESLVLPWYLASISALDRYYRRPLGDNVYVTVRASLIDLARSIGNLEYPGLDAWDACAPLGDGTIYFRCVEDDSDYPRFSFPVLDFLFDPASGKFLDRADAYYELRAGAPSVRSDDGSAVLREAAVLAARYGLQTDAPGGRTQPGTIPASAQRQLLIDVLSGDYCWKGLELLMDAGAIEALWPELQPMNDTGHSKEHHPEGNVWEHTMQALRYRKTRNLTLTMALLLHDSGKPYAQRTRERAFDKHAEIGARKAVTMLRRLGFSSALIDDVDWLIRNHMLPGNLHRLPTYRSENAMASPLFPLLLELYRCDLSSTYRGPEGYYRACKVYRSFLKHRANPFRTVDGKKLLRLYVE
jgi:poly(A) polymerase